MVSLFGYQQFRERIADIGSDIGPTEESRFLCSVLFKKGSITLIKFQGVIGGFFLFDRILINGFSYFFNLIV